MSTFAALIERMTKKIVITGGPGTGKTTLVGKLIEIGIPCLPEISREITLKARAEGIEQLFLEEPLLFSEKLIEGRMAQFAEASNSSNDVVFLDRGLPDVIAYMDFIGDAYPQKFEEICVQNQYDLVFILPPWEAIYVSDDARYENFTQAKLIDQHLMATYQRFGYQPIVVPKASPAERLQFILDELDSK